MNTAAPGPGDSAPRILSGRLSSDLGPALDDHLSIVEGRLVVRDLLLFIDTLDAAIRGGYALPGMLPDAIVARAHAFLEGRAS